MVERRKSRSCGSGGGRGDGLRGCGNGSQEGKDGEVGRCLGGHGR